ncbi:hypothetical protein C8Q78DRAFT_1042173 [Trametes maxima]|nr:hypothetical protein C8Q78DRAFT_1042173 [Trametes maxima]
MSTVVNPAPTAPCNRCNRTHSTPAAFLMACGRCERTWHHSTYYVCNVRQFEYRFNADACGTPQRATYPP